MRYFRIVILFVTSVFLFQSCTDKSYIDTGSLDGIAKSYVKLSFGLSRYDKDYIDGYIGPEKLKQESMKDSLSLQQIIEYSDQLILALDEPGLDNGNQKTSSERIKFLKSLLLSLKTRAEITSGVKYTFDKESMLIFGVSSPTLSLDYYRNILTEIDSLLPGSGDISQRWDKFRSQFIIPREQLDTVFKAAIQECRARTLKYINLPEDENFEFEFVENVPWGAYNWYKGNNKSLIQVNISMPIYIDRAIDYACHEGYPGHHSYHVSHEAILYKKNGWIEHSIVPLYSPQAIISEGLANYGIEIAFTKSERLDFEKNVLCKLAGVNPENLELYYEILEQRDKLRFTGIEAARRYLDGKITKHQAVNWLIQYQLRTEEEANNNIAFYEKYRTYIISYALGLEMTREYFDSRNLQTTDEKWAAYSELISKPILPEDMQTKK